MDNTYVYTAQLVSYNSGDDFEVTAEWKHLRDDSSVKMANEWVSTPEQRIPYTEPELPPRGCGVVEFRGCW